MAYRWTILKAAVEQQILFPAKSCYDEYIRTLTLKGEPFEVSSVCDNADGTVTTTIRKRYNNNLFLSSENKSTNLV